jgi:hypothetical protein
MHLNKDGLESFEEALSRDPLKITYRTINACNLISGQVTLKSSLGTGMLNPLCVKEGLVLNEDIKVVFEQFNKVLFFHKRDKLLIEAVVELVRNKYDELTSDGVCIKPIYARPAGYSSAAGEPGSEVYTFELQHILDGKASLPYLLYVTNSDGSRIPNAVPVLANKINVRIYKDVYLQFSPGNVTITEINEICKKKFEEVKPILMNVHWGLISAETTLQKPQGKFIRRLDGIVFKLVDLLMGRSYLPIHTYEGKYCLSQDIFISIDGEEISFTSGTNMQTLWDRWCPHSVDTTCPSEYKENNLCIYTPADLLDDKIDLPTAKGLVLNERVVVKFSEDSILCYDINTSVQSLVWQLHRLRKGNNPLEYNYTFIHRHTLRKVKPDKIYHSFLKIKEDFGETIDKNVLLIIDDIVMPCPIPSGTPKSAAERVYLKIQKQLNQMKKDEFARYRMWKR